MSKIKISTSEDNGKKVIQVKYMTGVDDGANHELNFTITAGENYRGMGRMRELVRYAVIYQDQNDFQLEEFDARKAKDIAHAYHRAAKIVKLLEKSYPEVDPKISELMYDEQEYGYASSDSDILPF